MEFPAYGLAVPNRSIEQFEWGTRLPGPSQRDVGDIVEKDAKVIRHWRGRRSVPVEKMLTWENLLGMLQAQASFNCSTNPFSSGRAIVFRNYKAAPTAAALLQTLFRNQHSVALQRASRTP
jgi:hypothetical protein